MHYDFVPRGVCSRMIHIDLDETRQNITSVSFEGGCPGNLSAISKLLEGMPVDHVVELLEGNVCGMRPTSCTDQLTRGLRAAQAAEGDVWLEAPAARARTSF